MLVAFSGGVDSTALALLSKMAADETLLVTVASQTVPSSETDRARRVADELGLPLRVVEYDWLGNPALVKNPPERCYLCKRALATLWLSMAQQHGLTLVVEGTTASDMEGHRPGHAALVEAGVVSPLLDAGLTKSDVRELLRSHGLSVAGLPSGACLATRFPYHTRVTAERLAAVETIEGLVIRRFGVRSVRARLHGDLVRIEVGHDERPLLFDSDGLDELHRAVRALGMRYVTVDVWGYRTGSMDETL